MGQKGAKPDAPQWKHQGSDVKHLGIFLNAILEEKRPLCVGLALAVVVCLLALGFPKISDWKRESEAEKSHNNRIQWESVGHGKKMPRDQNFNFYILLDISATTAEDEELRNHIKASIKEFHRDNFDSLWCAFFGRRVYPDPGSLIHSTNSEICTSEPPQNQISRTEYPDLRRRTDIIKGVEALQGAIEDDGMTTRSNNNTHLHTDLIFIISDGAHDTTGHNQTCPSEGIDIIGDELRTAIHSLVGAISKHAMNVQVLLLLTNQRDCSGHVKKLWDQSFSAMGIQTAAITRRAQIDEIIGNFIKSSFEGYYFNIEPREANEDLNQAQRQKLMNGSAFRVNYQIKANHLPGTIGPKAIRIAGAHLISDEPNPILLQPSGSTTWSGPTGTEIEPIVISIPSQGTQTTLREIVFTFIAGQELRVRKDKDYRLQLVPTPPSPRSTQIELKIRRPFREKAGSSLFFIYRVIAFPVIGMGLVGAIIAGISSWKERSTKYVVFAENFPKNCYWVNISLLLAVSAAYVTAISFSARAMLALIISALGLAFLGLRGVPDDRKTPLLMNLLNIFCWLTTLLLSIQSTTSGSP